MDAPGETPAGRIAETAVLRSKVMIRSKLPAQLFASMRRAQVQQRSDWHNPRRINVLVFLPFELARLRLLLWELRHLVLIVFSRSNLRN